MNPSYIGSRADILELIPEAVSSILDVGCSNGALGENLKKRCPVFVCGIEVDPEMAEIAKTRLDKVIQADLESLDFIGEFGASRFDCVVCADILEHLRDPWNCLKNLARILSSSGILILSIPNVRHFSTIYELTFKGYWPYRERGIHDRTHLRFFTLKNMLELLAEANLEPTKTHRNYRIIERPHKRNRLARLFAIPFIRDFLTFQYLITARKKPE